VDGEVVARVQQSTRVALDRLYLLAADVPLVVAVSGGADSTCLLDALIAVVPDAQARLVVGHVDHQLRPESDADAEHVRALAAGYGLRCHVLTVEVPALAAAEGRGTEEAARLGRYRALRDGFPDLARGPVPCIATGHTRNDAVETVLLHLLRGSGAAGLDGIAESEILGPAALGDVSFDPDGSAPALRVVRPLLKVGRTETVAYCQARGLTWRDDESNADPQFLRNRVRNHLLPVLRTYNPAIDDAIVRLATVMQDENRWLDNVAAQCSREIIRWGERRATVSVHALAGQPVALQRRIVCRIAADAGYTDISFDAVERALAVSRTGGPPRAELGGGLTVTRSGDDLLFAPLTL